METKPEPVPSLTLAASVRHPGVIALLLGLLFGLTFNGAGHLLTRYELSEPLRLGVILAFLCFTVALGAAFRRFCPEDELQTLITRRALAFAFCAAVLCLVVVELLQAAAMLPPFTWSNKKVIVLLAALMCAGAILSKLRYR